MRLGCFAIDGEARLGLARGEEWVVDAAAAQRRLSEAGLVADGPLTGGDVRAVIEDWDGPAGQALRALHHALETAGDANWLAPGAGVVFALEEVEMLPPLGTPRKNVLCLGKNYADHAREMKSERPEYPVVFSKATSSLTGHGSGILRHRGVTDQLDYEGELAVVVGRRARGVSRKEAMDYIFGYTLINDVTARDWQRRHLQWHLGKSFDTFCPMGPFVVPKEDAPPIQEMVLETRVNGELRQRGRLTDLIFDIPTILEVISAGITLEPGDVIATGTPAGVGMGFQPPRFLDVGDRIEISVNGIGTLRNWVIEG
ncbi:fumarylacetoacetate hydrolase family protein [Kyrpidia tusciae]|uniref:5-carboxymethyl-2-hydroxymuconateDelta-isomerase n=1 Tax=Kyrpidia tusciae (strain DSM 2912 / NBRC 15312 / T2) TaxID=562970 RepID=D5WRH6_KYRT2|nr:fumarylacetoacetate hydrolase family protein [Kyrpidia tusciae]ADG04837.1 5-carboxymethyl-2-hydroxymuconateDelta-isomerase [Kyrpidia tusciae DSM 2912]